MSTEVRFWAKVRKTGTCWLWLGSTNRGYGRFGGTLAHRWSFVHFVGPVPEGKELDHRCRVRACVRPDHLEPVTHWENVLRGIAAKTHCRRGHSLSGDNLRVRSDSGARQCVACVRQLANERNLRQREQVRARFADFHTVEEVAQSFQVPPRTVLGMCRRGELAHIRVSKAIRIERSALNRYLTPQFSQ